MTPGAVHYGGAAELQAVRSAALTAAYAAHPERFVKGPPRPWPLLTAAWINRPEIKTTSKEVTPDGSLISRGKVSQRG
jgi:putative transposase